MTSYSYRAQLGFSRIPFVSLHKTDVVGVGVQTYNQFPIFPRDDRKPDIRQTDGGVNTVGSTNTNTFSDKLNSLKL